LLLPQTAFSLKAIITRTIMNIGGYKIRIKEGLHFSGAVALAKSRDIAAL
jgi:hypothetical protein